MSNEKDQLFNTDFSNVIQIEFDDEEDVEEKKDCLLYTSPSPRDGLLSRMPSSA